LFTAFVGIVVAEVKLVYFYFFMNSFGFASVNLTTEVSRA